MKPNLLGLAYLIFGSRIHWFRFLSLRENRNLQLHMSRLQKLNVGVAQAIHTFGHLKGVVIHDNSLLSPRKKNVPYEGEYDVFQAPW